MIWRWPRDGEKPEDGLEVEPTGLAGGMDVVAPRMLLS